MSNMTKRCLFLSILLLQSIGLLSQTCFEELTTALCNAFPRKVELAEKVLRSSANGAYMNTVVLRTELNHSDSAKRACILKYIDEELFVAPESNRYKKRDTLTYTMIWRDTSRAMVQAPHYYSLHGIEMLRDLSVRSYLLYRQYGNKLLVVLNQTEYLDKVASERACDFSDIDSLLYRMSKVRGARSFPVRYSYNEKIDWLNIWREAAPSVGTRYELPPSKENRKRYRMLYDIAKKKTANHDTLFDWIEEDDMVYFLSSYTQGVSFRLLPNGALQILRLSARNSVAYPYKWYDYRIISKTEIK